MRCAGMLALLVPVVLARRPHSPESPECPSGSVPRGLLLDFSHDDEVVNNLGGYPGGRDIGGGVNCDPRARFDLPMYDGEICPCGCGCRCDNEDEVAPPGTPEELRYSRVGFIYTGDGSEPVEVDVVVTNLTMYTPWRTEDTGHHTLNSLTESSNSAFAQISMLEGTSTTFRYSFMEPDTTTPVEMPSAPLPARSSPRYPHASLPHTSGASPRPRSPGRCSRRLRVLLL